MLESKETRETEARLAPTVRDSETDEAGHERNPVAAAQKQASSQETAGLMDTE